MIKKYRQIGGSMGSSNLSVGAGISQGGGGGLSITMKKIVPIVRTVLPMNVSMNKIVPINRTKGA